MPLVLVGGGSRSGKSSFASRLALEGGARRAFVATAEVLDDEMRDRIARHRADRDASFVTIEEPLDLVRVLTERESSFDVILVDCLTLWLSNLMMRDEPNIEGKGKALVEAAAASKALCILVTNEVGGGVVPDNVMARRFRDLAGRLNQHAASAATEVYLLTFGIPIRLK